MAHTLHLIELEEQITRSKYTILPPVALLLFTARVHAPLEGRLIILICFWYVCLKVVPAFEKILCPLWVGFSFYIYI